MESKNSLQGFEIILNPEHNPLLEQIDRNESCPEGIMKDTMDNSHNPLLEQYGNQREYLLHLGSMHFPLFLKKYNLNNKL